VTNVEDIGAFFTVSLRLEIEIDILEVADGVGTEEVLFLGFAFMGSSFKQDFLPQHWMTIRFGLCFLLPNSQSDQKCLEKVIIF